MKPLRYLVTAGPTREFFDPIRYISNRSSGKMGYAIAKAAAKMGAVTLISGPTALPQPTGLQFVSVTTAAEMAAAVFHAFAKRRQVLVGFAAETNDLEQHARDKLQRKNLDLIVANDSRAFDSDTNIVTLIHRNGSIERLPEQAKTKVAREILKRVETLVRK